MSQLFDDLSKLVSRVAVFRPGNPVPFASNARVRPVTGGKRQVVQDGPCVGATDGTSRTVDISTTMTGQTGLLALDVASTYGPPDARSEVTLTMTDGKTRAVSMRASLEHGVRRSSVELASGYGALRSVDINVDNGIEQVQVNGSLVSVPPLSELIESLSTPSVAAEFLRELRLAPVEIDPDLLRSIEDIAALAERTIPGCAPSLAALDALDATAEFAGCDACNDDCDKKFRLCVTACFGEAASCYLGYAVCFAICGGNCLGDKADCLNRCKDPPGPCCPRGCSDPETNTFSCCQTSDRCCGSTCCDAGPCCGSTCCDFGEVCASAELGVCCREGHGQVCKNNLLPPGFRCANPSIAFCCEERAGEYCPTFAEERCCPPGEWCADKDTGTCCPRDQSVCGGACCPDDMECINNVCCDRTQLCGGQCCLGVCRGDECCSYPSHWCGDFCCPPFNECCSVDGQPVCCGAYEVCMRSGCCPVDRACGEECCPPGYRCVDPEAGICESCGGTPDMRLQACKSGLEDGSVVSVCCPPNVTCCRGDCCQPGEICCDPMDGNGAHCYSSDVCIH